jgi:alkanesulfonate monooxygenase SsuD/methylene tetrahydromethanopterin reductase-like flavin-dependent oxidoreductase (luciferase family)
VQAKQVASLDRISNGRFLFGVGAGWNKEEMANHGTPPRKRWKVLTERLESMKTLWTEDEASYHGEFVNFDRIWSYPKPLTKPHPQILLGSLNSPVGRQRAVDLCDGWIPVETAIADMPASIADLHERARAAGRDPGSIPISFFCVHAAGIERLERYRSLGAVRTVVRAPTAGREEILPFLDRYAEIARKLA